MVGKHLAAMIRCQEGTEVGWDEENMPEMRIAAISLPSNQNGKAFQNAVAMDPSLNLLSLVKQSLDGINLNISVNYR